MVFRSIKFSILPWLSLHWYQYNALITQTGTNHPNTEYMIIYIFLCGGNFFLWSKWYHLKSDTPYNFITCIFLCFSLQYYFVVAYTSDKCTNHNEVIEMIKHSPLLLLPPSITNNFITLENDELWIVKYHTDIFFMTSAFI